MQATAALLYLDDGRITGRFPLMDGTLDHHEDESPKARELWASRLQVVAAPLLGVAP
jgi:hypothetical protein